MTDYENRFKNFICPKCRGRSFFVEEVSLCPLSKRLLLKGNENKYALVSCGLCGYTEMYNLKVAVPTEEEILTKETAPVIEKQ
ncbi:MAG: zinc ribbon domain-containing protein [bacterium]|jgi:predicted nucleic-acid-binding Zn-ribbon protein|nr:zinc ribbon domain-containing protein [bacterium]